MAVRTIAEYSGLFLTTSGEWPNNTGGQITPAKLRAGLLDTWDSFTHEDIILNGYITTLSGNVDVIGQDNVTLSGRIDALSGYVETSRHSGLWKDMVSDLSRAPVGPSSPQFLQWLSGIYAYSFPNNLTRELFISFHIDHDWKPGTDLYPHVHWAPSTATGSGSYVKWGLEYTVAKGHQQQAFPTTVTTYVSGMVTGIQNLHMISETTSSAVIPGSGLEVDSIIMMRIFRDNTVANNYSASAWGLYVDLHYQSDRDGTPNKAPNFYL